MQGQSAVKVFAALWLAAIVALLNACASTSSQPELTNSGKQIAQAEKLSREQQYIAAARLYEDAAQHSSADMRNRLLLRAAREWLRADDLTHGENLLRQVDDNIPASDYTLRSLIAARAALLGRHPDRAIAELDRIPQPLPREEAPAALELRTQALFAYGRPAGAVITALDREQLLTDANEVMRNRRMIWDGIQRSAAVGANLQVPAGASRQVAGWLELGRAALTASRDAFAAQPAIDDWRARYPEHPANEFLTQQVMPQLRTAMTFPAQIALLLPLSGRQQTAGMAVRDGFVAALLLQLNAEQRPTLRIYDSAGGAVPAYQRAVADGAKFVVGPLVKEDVAALIASQQISVPTLALNYPAEQAAATPNLFEFSLDPTEEARQAAAKVTADNLMHGIALLPKNDWGERVHRAFEAELRQRGGKLVGTHFYDPAARDYTPPISMALLVNESKARAAALNAALNTKLEFEPRPRSDAEFIFVGAEPLQGRLLRPALRFNLTEAIPIFATSDIFEPNAAANADLDGVMFPDMPWVIAPDETATQLRTALNKYWPARARAPGRLYAFGFDAYRLIPLLLSQNTDAPIDKTLGMTGRLTIDPSARIHRELEWARITNGQPQLLDATSAKSSATTGLP